MFTGGFKELSLAEITINDVSSAILQKLIEYCYLGQITIDSVNVDEIARSASMLQFNKVLEHCSEFYQTKLSASNCIGIRYIADLLNLIELKNLAHAFVLDHFGEVSQGDEFPELNVEYLSELLKDEKINVAAEEDVFNALMRWLKYDVERRRKSLETLLECVRFQHVKDSVSN